MISSGRQSANTLCVWWIKGDSVRYRARVRPCDLAGRWHDVMQAVQGVERRGGRGVGGQWTSSSRSARGRRASNSSTLQRIVRGVGPALRLTIVGVSTSPPCAVSQAAPWLDWAEPCRRGSKRVREPGGVRHATCLPKIKASPVAPRAMRATSSSWLRRWKLTCRHGSRLLRRAGEFLRPRPMPVKHRSCLCALQWCDCGT